MNTKKFNNIVCSFFLLFAIHASAQRTTVSAALNKNRILIGQHIKLTLEADIPENEPIHFFSIDSLPHFEILNKENIDTTNTSSGTVLKQVIRITSFDSGHWVIPSFSLDDGIVTDTLPVDVMFTPFDSTQDYHDIKDILDVPPPKPKQTWWWYILGASVLAVAVIIYLLMGKKKPPVVVPVAAINPYLEAMKQLEKLVEGKPEQKQYYSGLVDIFRLYIFRKKGVLSLSKTTDDLVFQMKGIALARDQFERLSQSLRLADFVKFAKYQPSAEEDKNALETVKQTIDAVEQIQ